MYMCVVCVCVHMCVHICVYVCGVCVCAHVCTHMCIYTCVWCVCTCVWCMCVCVSMCDSLADEKAKVEQQKEYFAKLEAEMKNDKAQSSPPPEVISFTHYRNLYL